MVSAGFRINHTNIAPIAVFIAFAWLVHQPFINAVKIWIGNDIYNHCIIVLPASLYLMWERRELFRTIPISYSWLAIPCLVAQLLLYTLGTAAGIQLFQHAALFSMMPTLLWLFLGDRLAWEFKFPLCFMVFAIPVGEELIPFLQEITADMSVILLQWSGIPLFRSGLFIEIPKGKFLVAEACSGVSFLIASIVLGNLYAYMNLVTMRYRIFFVILSIIFPIFANAIRVYGIIGVAHLTDMEHAAGADHLIYGWFFFAFVLLCLFFIGELVKRREQRGKLNTSRNHSVQYEGPRVNASVIKKSKDLIIPFVVSAIFLLTLWQDYRMLNPKLNEMMTTTVSLPFTEVTFLQRVPWEPSYSEASLKNKLQYTDNDSQRFEVFYAYYASIKGELVSSLNKLYLQDNWTLVSREDLIVGNSLINKSVIASSIGTRQIVYHWYLVESQVVESAKQVKIKQAFHLLKGNKPLVGIFAVGLQVESQNEIKDAHESFVKNLDPIVLGSQTVSRF